jgi:Membrane bound O-acyl transferase family
MFNAPFAASSLADFWTRRWHAIFRRVFDRLSMAILFPISRSSPPSLAQRTTRSVVIFGLSASLHILVMHRASMLEPKYPGAFINPSVLKFFLSQPIFLAFEFFVLLPACNAFAPTRWQSSVSRLWTWVFIIWAGRFWSDAWVFRGFLDEREKVVGWSVVRGVLYGKWAV